MRRIIVITMSMLVWLFPPNLVLSDCLDFGRATNWYRQDENSIIFYNQYRPMAKIVLQDCTVNSSSNIRLTKSYMCNNDTLIIDGEECAIMSIKSAASGSF